MTMLDHHRTTTRRHHRRRGSLTAELLFVLPILLVFLLGTVEYSMLFLAEQQLMVASREGARVAALGGTSTDVEQAARQVLGTGSLGQATVESVLTDDLGQPLPTGSPVAVTVSIPAAQAVPDLLAFAGLSIRNQTLAAQTVMRKE
jgi:Flp pilus assembly protein TadG